jgi:colanic acid/amylovoran biosynthesis protein
MKILLTGLALSRNLGAPAMALTLIDKVMKRFPDASFVMAVSVLDMEQELQWLEYYKKLGYKIEYLVPRSTIPSFLLNYFPVKKIYQFISGKYKLPGYQNQKNRNFWLKQHHEYLNEVKNSDLIISMFGISYVGDRVHKIFDGLADYSTFYYAKKYGVPYNRFIQSYGPFDDIKIRFFAKKELNALPFVFARGKNSAAYCRTIVKNKEKVYDVPDLAILLKPSSKEWSKNYLTNIGLKQKEYIILSPSAVIYAMPKKVKGSIGEEHVRSFVLIAKKLIEQGNKILMLPHMYSDKKYECDREICYKIFNKLSDIEKRNVYIVKEDLDPMQAKSLISQSKLAIVSRYHALVAAVSTTTPVITIGWNIKYYDLMEYYGIEDMAIDTRNNTPEKLLEEVIEKISFYENDRNLLIYKLMKERSEKKVLKALKKLFDWIKNAKN